LFLLEEPDVWGSFGHFLISGECEYENGQLLIYRTGPFAPPVARPGFGIMVVTDSFRRDLERSGLTGLTFYPTIKRRITEIHWEDWDRQRMPGPLPPIESIEDLVMALPHSEEASQAMGPLWEARPEPLAELESFNKRKPWDYDLRLIPTSQGLPRLDFFRDTECRWLVVSKKAKEWLETRVPEWVQFGPLFIKGRQQG
jgi:hypothetical protein